MKVLEVQPNRNRSTVGLYFVISSKYFTACGTTSPMREGC